jgi:hypothetical protein
VAIDRFLARIDWSKWTAKGGYILQRRLPKARRTKDIDLSTGDVSFVISDRPAQQQALLEAFQQMAQADAGDYFEFQVLADKPALMASAPFFNSARQRGVVKALLSTHIHRLLVAGH